jgi:hypothetical protein
LGQGYVIQAESALEAACRWSPIIFEGNKRFYF